jgi:hypothetical protein
MPSNRNVLYVDFGFASARQYWDEVVLPARDRFTAAPNRTHAIEAAVAAWHLHEWLWHERNPGEDTQGNKKYRAFRDTLLSDCPELTWVRDVADAGKHRGLGRQAEVRRMMDSAAAGGFGAFAFGVSPFGGTEPVPIPLTIALNDGSYHQLKDVLTKVIEYWRTSWFSDMDQASPS